MLTRDNLRSLLGEGFHTAFRKAVDSKKAVEIHRMISEFDDEEWAQVVEFVAHGLESAGVQTVTPAPAGADEHEHITNAQVGIEGLIDYHRGAGGSWTLTCSQHGSLATRGGTAEDHDILVHLWADHELHVHGSAGGVAESMLINRPVRVSSH